MFIYNFLSHFFRFSLPECASEMSKILIPLSMANLRMASACSSDTPGEKTGQVPRPTFETRKPLLPRFLYRKPGVGAAPCRAGNAAFEPKLIERPSENRGKREKKITDVRVKQFVTRANIMKLKKEAIAFA